MNVAIPLIPSFAWLLAIALSMSLMLTIFFLYLFQRQRTALITGLQGSVASLSVKEERLTEEIKQLNEDKSKIKDYIQKQKQDLLRLNAEQAKHATLRSELDEMTRQLSENRDQSDNLRTEVKTLELENRLLNERKNEIQTEVSSLTSRRDEVVEKLEEFKTAIQEQKQNNKDQLIEIQRVHERAVEKQKNQHIRLLAEAEDRHKKRVEQLLEKIKKPILEKKESITALENNIQALNDEFDQRKKEASEELHELISKIEKKEVRLQSLGSECGNKERWIADAENKIEGLRVKKIEMEGEVESLKDVLSKLQQGQKELLEIEGRIVELTVRLQSLQSECSQKELNLREFHSLEQQKNDLLLSLEAKTNDRQADIDEINNTRHKAQGELDRLISKVVVEKGELVKIEEGKAAFQRDINSLAIDKIILEKEQNRLEMEFKKLKEEFIKITFKKEDILKTEERRWELQQGINRLEIEKNRLEDELKKMEKRIQPGGNVDSIADLLEEPACLNGTIFPDKSLQTDEVQMLQNFKQSLKNEKLFFHDRVINAFHTSLKCAGINPLTVLAGISGTGKTLLPIKYAQFMGMHQLILSVQPRWDSPQDMFGFYNYLENRYKATDLSRALVRMDEYNPFGDVGGKSKDRMLMVLMDEMNLARTEYYFSEFLSKLELRRDIKDFSDFSKRQKAEIVLDVGPGVNDMSRLWVGSNVLFVGTMNEDESTLSLSDKVLDRSHVLRFGKPEKVSPEFNNVVNVPNADGFLPYDLWQNHWIKKYDAIFPWSDEVAGWTEEINNALHKVSRAFGFRTKSAMKAYVANYPESGEAGNIYKQAFADLIEQKIMPRVRGLELMEQHSKECLVQIQDVVNLLGDNEFSIAFQNAMDNSHSGLFQWNGVSRSLED